MGKAGRMLLIFVVALAVPACGGRKKNAPPVPGTVVVTPVTSTTSEASGGPTASFTVVLGKLPSANVTIAVSSSNVLEGVPSTALLTFTAAGPTAWNIPQTVTVTGIDDSLDDGDKPYTIVLGAVVSTDTTYSGVDPADVDLTNTDDDTAGFIITPTSGLTTSEAGGTASFTVKLATQPASDVSITFSSDNVLEGVLSAATVTLTFTALPGATAWDQIQTINITGVDGDALVDPDTIYHIVSAAAVGGGVGYDTVNPPDVEVTNTDNDAPGITVNTSGGVVTNESGLTDSFTVALSSQPTADVTITVTSLNTAAGLVSVVGSTTPETFKVLTFTALNWDAAQTVTVHPVDDDPPTVNTPVVYNIELNPSSPGGGGDALYEALASVNVSVSHENNDVGGITVTQTSPPLVTTEAAGFAEFTVRLDTVPTSNVRLTVVSSNTNEGTVDKTELIFLSGDVSALNPQTVRITGVQDAVIDPDTAYTITLTVDTGVTTDGNYSGLTLAPVNVTNTDDDLPGFNLSGNVLTLQTSETGTTDVFQVALTSIPSAQVTINFAVTVGVGEVLAPTSVVFAANDPNALLPVDVTVTGQDDGAIDGNVAFTIVATAVSTDGNYSGKTFNAGGSNADDDTAPPGTGPFTNPGSPGIPAGAAGAWNDKSSQEPSVIRFSPISYVMWFEGANATGPKQEQIGRATSTDGLAWTIAPAPVFTPTGTNGTFDKNGAGDPSVLFTGGLHHMWYAGRENAGQKNKIGYANSADGITSWTRKNGGSAVLVGSLTFDSVGVSGPAVIQDGLTLHMFYTGLDGTGAHRIGHAVSTPTIAAPAEINGVTWTKTGTAVLIPGTAGAFDAFAVKLCGVVIDGANLLMWYVGTDVSGLAGRQKIGFATSTLAAPTVWQKYSGNPVLSTGTAGAFDERNLWSPWVLFDPDANKFKMWYGGQNNAGVIRIGYGESQ